MLATLFSSDPDAISNGSRWTWPRAVAAGHMGISCQKYESSEFAKVEAVKQNAALVPSPSKSGVLPFSSS